MRFFKTFTMVFASLLTAYSPVTWASQDIQRKAALNSYLKKNFAGTYKDAYFRAGHRLDYRSQGIAEAWLGKNGKTKIPQPEAQLIKDKNGIETLKLVFNVRGKTLTVTTTNQNPHQLTLNGISFARHELHHMTAVLTKLSANDASLRKPALQMASSPLRAPKKSNLLSWAKFSKLSSIQKVEYLAHIRLVMEAGQKVKDEAVKKQNQASLPWDMQEAYANNPVVKVNDACVVAGHISTYQMCGPSLCCQVPEHAYDKRCDPKQGNVACEITAYGGNPQTKKPHCIQSTDQPTFTEKATELCGKASPLGPKDSKQREAAYRRILESYHVLQGGDAEKLKACFNKENHVNPDCREIFEGHLEKFRKNHAQAADVCMPIIARQAGLKDQPHACEELLARELEMITFIQSVELNGLGVTPVDVEVEGCNKSGFLVNEETGRCECPDGREAVEEREKTFEAGSKVYVCPPVEDRTPTPVVQEEKEEHNWAPLLIIAAIIAGLFLIRDKDKPTTPVTPTTPTTLPPGTPPTTVLPTITTLPPVPTTTMPVTPPPCVGEGCGGLPPTPGGVGGARPGSGAK